MLLLSRYLKLGKRLVVYLFLFSNMLSSQNLIQNGSFENYTSPVNCTGGGGGFDNYTVFPVNHVVDYWYPLNSPDYFSQLCSGPNNDGAPVNIIGYSQAKQGSNYVGEILFQASTETKEYIYQQLSTPLQAGKLYCLSFYVSRVDRVTHAIHSIGAYFSNSAQATGTLGYVNVTPQVVNQNGFITDTTNWTQIQGCFTAVGGEQYVTIGNFNSNVNTDTLFVGSNNPHPGAYKYAYYYIDDITLIDQSTVGVNELGNGNSFEVYPNPSNGLVTVTSRFDFEKIELLSVTGQILLSEKVIAKTRELNLTDLSEGIYFVRVVYPSGLSTVKKVVKQ